jgi:hypothetical protein
MLDNTEYSYEIEPTLGGCSIFIKKQGSEKVKTFFLAKQTNNEALESFLDSLTKTQCDQWFKNL